MPEPHTTRDTALGRLARPTVPSQEPRRFSGLLLALLPLAALAALIWVTADRWWPAVSVRGVRAVSLPATAGTPAATAAVQCSGWIAAIARGG